MGLEGWLALVEHSDNRENIVRHCTATDHLYPLTVDTGLGPVPIL